MAKRRGPGTRKTRAIQNALDRLGMAASPAQVVGALAEFGIEVTETLVRLVKVQMLKRVAKVERQQTQIPRAGRPQARRPPKVPPRRSFRS
jgi:hypothetical protein